MTLQFALHLNLMLNKPAGARPVRERIAGGPTAGARDIRDVSSVARETSPRLKLLRDYLLGMAAPASTPRESASARSADAPSRTQAVTLQFSHRLNALLNMMIETRQNLQRIASVLPGETRASAFNPGRRNQTAPPLPARRAALLGMAAPEDTPRRFFRTARHRVLDRSIPARAMAPSATRWFGEAAMAGRGLHATRPGGVALAETQLANRRGHRSRPFTTPGVEQTPSWPATRWFGEAAIAGGGLHATRPIGVAPAETQLAHRRGYRSRPFTTPAAVQTPSRPAALRAARPVSETPRRVFRPSVERATLTEPARRTPDRSHQETTGTQPLAPIMLAWRRAPNGALAQDAHAAPSASMSARTGAAHAVMPAPRDVPSALNARMPRQAGTQLDSAMMNRLTHEVIGRIEQKMRIERERRGL